MFQSCELLENRPQTNEGLEKGINFMMKWLGISRDTSDRILEKSHFLVISATILPKWLGA